MITEVKWDQDTEIAQVTARSGATGKIHTREMKFKIADFDSWNRGACNIQDALPYLSADDREFLMTGMTPEEWDMYVPKDDE